MSQLVVLPVILPLLVAVVAVLFWRHPLIQRALALLTSTAVLGLGLTLLFTAREQGPQVTQLGNWPAPFGIVLVADLLSTLMVSATAVIAVASLGLTLATAQRQQEQYLHPLFLLLLAGVNGAFLTGDIFNLFVFFEVTLIATYALMSIGGRALQMEGAFKYVVINLIASTLFLTGVGLLYGLMGTLNMAHLSVRVAQAENTALLTAVATLLLVAFSIKAALIPLHFWLPGAYTHIPPGIASFFAGVLTKVGVYALFRVFTVVFSHDPQFFQPALLLLAGLSMGLGVLGAAVQKDMRTILSYHIISQIGYMIMGLGLFTVPAVSAGIFYILHHMPVKSALFLVAGSVEGLKGTGELKGLGGLARLYPLLGVLFLIPALSLAGFPPFSGFWGKVALMQAGFGLGNYAIVAVAMAVSLMTLFSMMKIWQWGFWGQETQAGTTRSDRAFLPSVALLALVTVLIAVFAQGLSDLTTTAAEQLMDPSIYVNAVLR